MASGARGQRILVVDDEPDIRDLLALALEEGGYRVDTVATARAALDAIRTAPPDLLVLDLMLPDTPGNDVCRYLRSQPETAALLILMLTAKSEQVDRIVGFEIGADDYMTKPFSPRELVLRVRALLRRRGGAEPSTQRLEHRDVCVDLVRHRSFSVGRELQLTSKEFQLLAALLRRPGRVLTREGLLREIWGSDITVTPRTIDTHMKRLREKLGPRADLVETVRGVGYRLAE